MRPTNTTTIATTIATTGTATATATTIDAGFHKRNSPIPCIFGVLAIMVQLIALVLIILACSYQKKSSNSSSGVQEEPSKAVQVLKTEMEPKIVVIMAGDDNPTYLTKPISSDSHTKQV
ncbi:protein GLUTAMINE DUMPER 6-like [Cornus florida]|uniref:protein GLUTAMINE DUMPER 6-like n=1 Tax=Cornus florida TaxID=4283 RepID=UPI00289B27EF|nr:protein GLUTAMINE DUMPER 6-like [Cornus florida]